MIKALKKKSPPPKYVKKLWEVPPTSERTKQLSFRCTEAELDVMRVNSARLREPQNIILLKALNQYYKYQIHRTKNLKNAPLLMLFDDVE